jgi:hypothetical protein
MLGWEVPENHSPTGLEPVSTDASLARKIGTGMEMGTGWFAASRLDGTSEAGLFSAPALLIHPKTLLVLGKAPVDGAGSGWPAGDDATSVLDDAVSAPCGHSPPMTCPPPRTPKSEISKQKAMERRMLTHPA